MKLASIEIVKSLRPHSNADRLELVQVQGWQSVVQKGIHKEGDKVVFIPIDTILPRASWSDFLQDKNRPKSPIRLKMVKLRGEHSAGIVIPLNTFSGFDDLEEGTDIADILQIKKYIIEIPAHLAGETEGDFPTHLISKTDEDNGLSDLQLVETVINISDVTITQKIDGSSLTIVIEDGEIKSVCSRNLAKKDTPNSAFWIAAKKLKPVPGFSGIIQGELAGNGIQSNPLGLAGLEIFVFQIKKESGKYMNYQEMKGFCNTELQCNVVPLVGEHSFVGADPDDALKILQDIADQQTYFTTGHPAEGVVVRPKDYPRSFESRRPHGFKILNRKYKDN